MDLVPGLKTATIAWLLVGLAIYLRAMMALVVTLLAERFETRPSRILRGMIRGMIVAMLLGPLAGLRGRVTIQKGRHDDEETS